MSYLIDGIEEKKTTGVNVSISLYLVKWWTKSMLFSTYPPLSPFLLSVKTSISIEMALMLTNARLFSTLITLLLSPFLYSVFPPLTLSVIKQ